MALFFVLQVSSVPFWIIVSLSIQKDKIHTRKVEQSVRRFVPSMRVLIAYYNPTPGVVGEGMPLDP